MRPAAAGVCALAHERVAAAGGGFQAGVVDDADVAAPVAA
jgi:hypothetical protein